jgi:hypothetical protein
LSGGGTPEISRFFGIVVSVNYDDHDPPHFHAKYGEWSATLEIESLTVQAGRLPPRATGLVTEWAGVHQEELRENWNLARRRAPLKRIPPLE